MFLTDESGYKRLVPDFDNRKVTDINGNALEMDTIYITAAGYINYPFRGITSDSALGWEEPVWGGNLTRSADFVLSNIDTVNFGLVARCEFTIKYMDANDYLVLTEMAKQRVVTVNYFNKERNERVTQEMAFTGQEMKKIYAIGGFVGAQDISVKLVATNREKAQLIKTKFNVTYNNNGGSGTIDTQQVYWSDATTLSSGSSFTKSGHRLLYWATKDKDGNFVRYYNPSQVVTIWEDLNLYAVWEAV